MIQRFVLFLVCVLAGPLVPGAQRQDWDLPDPTGKPIGFIRNVRDDIEARVKSLIDTL